MTPSFPTISSDGTDFILRIPSDNGGTSYPLRFPISRAEDMSRWLCERQQASAAASRIGTRPSPTQEQVNAWLAADNLRKKKKAEEDLAALAADFGLSVEEFKGLDL